MSRPKLPVWATGNYSAGPPWGSTPKRVQPGFDGFTPGTLLDAEHANYLYNDAYNQSKIVLSWNGQISVLNWNASVSSNTTNIVAGQASGATWLGVATGANDTASFSTDYGRTWSSFTFTSGKSVHIKDMAGDGGTNLVAVTPVTSVFLWIYRSPDSGTTWTYTTAYGGSLGTTATDGQVMYDSVNSLFFIATIHPNTTDGIFAGTCTVSSSITGVTGAGTPPANWASAISLGIITRLGTWVVSHLGAANTIYVDRTSNLAVTWNQVSFAPTLTATGTCRPCYDDANGVYVIGVYSAGATEFWTSPDLITWTQTSTMASTSVTSLAVIGSLWVANASTNKIYYSYDMGVTWMTDVPVTAASIWASPTQFCAFANGAVATSFRSGDGRVVTL